MKKQMNLHEAIVMALINIDKKTYAATINAIAAYIIKRELFAHTGTKATLSAQVKKAATKTKGGYNSLFHQIDDNTLQLMSWPLIEQRPMMRSVIVNGIDLTEYTIDREPLGEMPENERILL